ncbi:MAG: coproporphyrinogen III oxidase [Phycisphaerae bacterium]|nr:MAG: coproporphyrinogen III oxidase [Phycisphaerae bacterium]
MSKTISEQNLGLYLHWPFCESKCGYCDFYSVPLKGRDVEPLLAAFATDIRLRVAECNSPIDTIFWGGGTPTTLEHDNLDLALRHIQGATKSHPIREFTIEANPATIDAAKAVTLVERGVTRVSLGAQSFHQNELNALERLHVPRDVPEAIRIIRGAGITNYNIDLIFGVGGQTLTSWTESLKRAVDLEPTHLACYGLTYEHGTSLTKQLKLGTIVACDEQLEADMFLACKDFLESCGYEQYELSNYAKPGHQCLHNLIYWKNGSYQAVGPSAAGCLNEIRFKNACDINEYIRLINKDGHAMADREVITNAQRALEVLMMRMRLVDGLDLPDFNRCTGIDLTENCRNAIARLTDVGLISCDEFKLRMTRRGLLMADTVIRELAGELDPPSGLSLNVISSRPSTDA